VTTAAATPRPASPVSFFGRVAAVFLGWSALHALVVGSLVVGWLPGHWWTIAGVFLLLYVAPLAVILSNFRESAYPNAFTRVLVMRPYWYAQVSLFVLSVTGALAWLIGLPFHAGLAAARATLAGGSLFLLAFFVAGYVGSRSLVVKRVTVAFDDLPPALEGVTIAQLSDLHVGPHTPRGHLARIVKAVRDAKPDVIAFTGDQVDDYDQDVARFGEVFGDLRAPLGVYAIAGNHDIYAGWPGVRAGMEKVGMRVLVNEAVPTPDGHLWVAGTGDPAGAQGFAGGAPEAAPDLDRTLARIPPGAFSLVLAHNPALWPALAQRGARLTLSGHTHHGQLSIPALDWSLSGMFLDLAHGEHRRGGSHLYINPGTNFWGLPLRLGAWPEVTVLTLRRG
jgi:predicted MPP superfamily phosphohydrolase